MKGLSVISRGQNELKFVSFLTEKTSQIQNSFTEGSTSFKWLHIMIRLGYQVNIWPNSCKITLKSANQKNKDFLVKTHFVPQDKSSCTTPLFVLLRVSLAIFSCHNISGPLCKDIKQAITKYIQRNRYFPSRFVVL